MKKTFLIIGLLGILSAACVIYVPVQEEYPPGEDVYYGETTPSRLDMAYVYDYLEGYGVWVSHPRYGYVWIPEDVWYGWRPYSYGRWVWTDFGWTWVSSFRWGWIPFHYGRWGYDPFIGGWFWVPDTVWAPAWVAWRRGRFYIGWAPLPPGVRFVPGVGITSVSVPIDISFWIFVESRDFLSRRLRRHVLPVERNLTIVRFTMMRANLVVERGRIVNRGIDVAEVQRLTKQRVSKYELKRADRPGPSRVSMDTVEMFHPEIEKNEAAKPKKVVSTTEVQKKIVPKKELRPRERVEPKRISLEQAQKEEMEKLEESQKAELKKLEDEMKQQKKKARTKAEEEEVEKVYREKIAKTKKSHEEEKAQMKARHSKEKKKKKKKIKK